MLFIEEEIAKIMKKTMELKGWSRTKAKLVDTVCGKHCCESGSGIRCLFTLGYGIRDPG
jgi:hypothetical protein